MYNLSRVYNFPDVIEIGQSIIRFPPISCKISRSERSVLCPVFTLLLTGYEYLLIEIPRVWTTEREKESETPNLKPDRVIIKSNTMEAMGKICYFQNSENCHLFYFREYYFYLHLNY